MSRPASLSGRAEADVTNQYRWYLNNADVEVADRFLDAFYRTVKQVAQMPGIGRLRPFRSSELRGTRSIMIREGFGAHLIFYRIAGGGVSVERVMHGARDLERRLLEPPKGYPPTL